MSEVEVKVVGIASTRRKRTGGDNNKVEEAKAKIEEAKVEIQKKVVVIKARAEILRKSSIGFTRA
eukprot:CAMPEP_0183777662 /NCGR_PEP_ID=MMETSP0739-20130205/49563_1 /TAXON_ID=385413 /ORGANISM="Thalassiosira miniscula, Strain CCMP1093" /LENGTH=64 /DNA_ID=CAMNT_0026019843 /DNA_START=110 /DNA_END=301 /DNA_ORIENTATION=-